MKEWVAQADSPKEANTLKNEWPETTHYFKKWTTSSGVLKKIHCLYKILMLQIDPVNSSCSQKLQ